MLERPRVWLAVVVAVAAAACSDSADSNESSSTNSNGATHTSNGGTSSGTTSNGSGGTANASSDGGTQSQETGAGGTSGVLCGGDPRMRCAVDCDFFACGEPTSGFDEDGCLRDFCVSDAGCGQNERCAFLYGDGGAAGEGSDVCISSWVICTPEENGLCSCGGGADCVGYCVPR